MTAVEGTAEDAGVELEQVHAPPALFRTDDPVEVVENATRVADALKQVIQQRNLFSTIQGKDHVRVEGWQLLGSMLGVTAVCTHTEPVEGGWKATVEARTADGRVIGRADALCTKMEKRGPWKTADDYARLSMAQTRATSKALKGPLGFVVSLAGYQTTPAEEMTFAEPEPAEVEVVQHVPVISEERARTIVEAVLEYKLEDRLQLAASHVAGFDVGDCSSPELATAALLRLSVPQAVRLEQWIVKNSPQEEGSK